jgi:MraZ protein
VRRDWLLTFPPVMRFGWSNFSLAIAEFVDGGVKWSKVARSGAAVLRRGAERRGPVFLGTHAPRLDDKGRLFLPAKFRDELADGLVITRGQERCLYVFPMAEFLRVAESLRAAPMTMKGVRDYLRVFTSGASDEVPDRQGRVTVPPALRQYAGLERDCAVIGAGTRVEIWDWQAWETYLAAQEQTFADLSEEVLPGLM